MPTILFFYNHWHWKFCVSQVVKAGNALIKEDISPDLHLVLSKVCCIRICPEINDLLPV